MTNTHATEAAEYTPRTVDTEGLAAMLGLGKSWIEKRVAARDWLTGRIPVPLEVTPNRRLWLRSAVIRWAEDTRARAEARVSQMSGGGRR